MLDFSQYDSLLRGIVKACTMLSRCPDIVTANSAAGLQAHLELGYHPRRFEILPNGIDLNIFKPDIAARAVLRQQLHVAQDRIVVAHVARVDPMKDHGTFLAAMAELPELTAWMIGAGTERLPDMPNVLRFGRRDDVAALLTAADFVASSSAFGEGFSNAIAEGMACGLPAVATDVGDAREIIGETGMIVPPRDHRAFVASLSTLANESVEARAARRAGARQHIAEHYSLDRAVARFSALYAARPDLGDPAV
jgi:glycosyltransferase involved in cell wall biosynthesis